VTPTSGAWQIEGRSISVSNLEKVFWPEDGLSKEDMLHYYLSVAPAILPYLKNRPVTLRIFPDGINGFSYYRRDRPENAPLWLRSVDYRPENSERVIQLPLIEVEAGQVRPSDLTLRVLPQRLRQMGDLFAPVLQGGQYLP